MDKKGKPSIPVLSYWQYKRVDGSMFATGCWLVQKHVTASRHDDYPIHRKEGQSARWAPIIILHY